MSIAVLGVTGMLGHKMFQVLRREFGDVWGTALEDTAAPPFDRVELLQDPRVRGGLDVSDFDALRAWLRGIKPEFVVNAVGIIKQRDAATAAVPSITLNALLPHVLAACAAEWGGRVIHFSTDCVFSGHKGAYTEEDVPDADDLYGRTKALGEVAGANALTLRTSIIGRELCAHRSLLDWFLAQNHGQVRGYRNVWYSGVTTLDLAAVVARVISSRPQLSGLYQAVADRISKHDLLELVRDRFGLDIEIVIDDGPAHDRSMRGDKLQAALGYTAAPWPVLVGALADDPTPYAKWGVSVGGYASPGECAAR